MPGQCVICPVHVLSSMVDTWSKEHEPLPLMCPCTLSILHSARCHVFTLPTVTLIGHVGKVVQLMCTYDNVGEVVQLMCTYDNIGKVVQLMCIYI